MAVGETVNAGPGTLVFGETGTEIDVSCQVNSLSLAPSKEQGDATTKLCGTVKQPAATYTWAMTGNLDLDLTDPAGLWALSEVAPGTEVAFEFIPNTDAGTAASGTVMIDPMAFGYDEYGATIASDIEWTLTEPPTFEVDGSPLSAAAFTWLDAELLDAGDAAELDPAV